MTIELRVPAVGESITEVQIGDWLKKVGDRVKAGEALAMIETDKVTVELPAPADGVLTHIAVEKGAMSTVGAVIGTLEAAAAQPKLAEGAAQTPSPAAVVPPTASAAAAPAHVMPSAARVAAESGLDPRALEGTGPGRRVLKEDVLAALSNRPQRSSSEPPRAAPRPSAGPVAPKRESGPVAGDTPAGPGSREERSVPMTPLRRRVAERLVQAQSEAALLTTFNEVDMSEVIELRTRYKEAFEKRHGVRLGFMSFFVKAVVEALNEVPQVNAEIRGDQIVTRSYCDIGVAIGGGKGLVVPILRNAETMSCAEIEKKIGEYAARAKNNQLTLEELQGGTFSISNGGVYGSMLSTPIVNPPQSGILGLHAIQDRPVARDGQVVIRPMMYVALTYDHRLVDGREAVTFLRRVKDFVESPARMLLEV